MGSRRVKGATLAGWLVASAVVATGVGGWFIHREAECRARLESVERLGDVQVRRDGVGQCYVCRRDGPLYDILYPYCSADDPVYRG